MKKKASNQISSFIIWGLIFSLGVFIAEYFIPFTNLQNTFFTILITGLIIEIVSKISQVIRYQSEFKINSFFIFWTVLIAFLYYLITVFLLPYLDLASYILYLLTLGFTLSLFTHIIWRFQLNSLRSNQLLIISLILGLILFFLINGLSFETNSPNSYCPNFNNVTLSGTNLYIKEENLEGWSLGVYPYTSFFGVTYEEGYLVSEITLKCRSGTEEGENINNIYCTSAETVRDSYSFTNYWAYVEKDRVSETGEIGQLVRKSFRITLTDQGEIVSSSCGDDPGNTLNEYQQQTMEEWEKLLFGD
ncbi:MAG TPA: hypothetical protein HA360_00800 [Nanoarchaeota archaeon]|nr:hypothetical protein [Candidatus Woesearchaeota archaeon]HIH15677.1 hypothetical protein [Nanoarchaeota archaeon]HIH59332.1 hypothetical protein [Nanoarchaeota archaeon]HII13590.1 hypothetical protein [Nanoarchaeota archaeon]HIJ04789.1 hypothetical protein [Nanoarchaeota archaeon]